MAKTAKDKLETGDKKRAGRLLSNFIRQIAQEEIAVEVTSGESKMITKAEALARQIWDRALGKFVKHVDMESGAILYEAPDKAMVTLLFDRIEGKAGTIEDERKKNENIPSKVSRKNAARINKIATGTNKKDSSLKSK